MLDDPATSSIAARARSFLSSTPEGQRIASVIQNISLDNNNNSQRNDNNNNNNNYSPSQYDEEEEDKHKGRQKKRSRSPRGSSASSRAGRRSNSNNNNNNNNNNLEEPFEEMFGFCWLPPIEDFLEGILGDSIHQLDHPDNLQSKSERKKAAFEVYRSIIMP